MRFLNLNICRFQVSSNLAVAMGKAMEDMTSCTYLKYKQKNCKPSHQSLFLFVTSVARTNFEIELVQRGGSLCVPTPTTIPLTPKRDCIGTLVFFDFNLSINLFISLF